MRNRFLGLVAAAALSASLAHATLLTQTLGTQSFNNGDSESTGAFTTPVDVAPFNTISGSDANGPDADLTWTFSGYGGAVLQPITSASLTLSIWDADTNAAGNQVASFTLNGSTNLTSVLNTAFEAAPSANGIVSIYTFDLTNAAFAALATGTSIFHLTLQGPGLGALGATTHNAAGLDFSSIAINTQDAGPSTPEPATLSLMGVGLIALGFAARRRK